MAKTTVRKEAFSPKEVSTILGVDYDTVTRWLRTGQMPSFKIGNTRRVHRHVLNELMGLSGGPTRERHPEPAEPIEADEDWG